MKKKELAPLQAKKLVAQSSPVLQKEETGGFLPDVLSVEEDRDSGKAGIQKKRRLYET